MNIQIRRNTSISFNVLNTDKNREAIKKLFEDMPKLTDEQQRMVDEGERNRSELERKIWAYLSQHPRTDLDGDLITEDTHEIGYDTELKDIDGCTWSVVKQIYIQPKKSIYDKNKEELK